MPAGVDKKGKKFIIRSRFNCYRERKMTNIVTMIPVRMASTRLPNKPLLDINGKSLLQRVYENVKKTVPGDVFVAAGDRVIVEACEKFGAKAVLTDPALPSVSRSYRSRAAFGYRPDRRGVKRN